MTEKNKSEGDVRPPLGDDAHRVLRSVLTPSESASALLEIWDFVEDVGRAPGLRRLWRRERGEAGGGSGSALRDLPSVFRSCGAGWILGSTREVLAERVFGPLFGTDYLRCSAEGFALVVGGGGGSGDGVGEGSPSVAMGDVSVAEGVNDGDDCDGGGGSGSEEKKEDDDAVEEGTKPRRPWRRRPLRCFAAFSDCEVSFSNLVASEEISDAAASAAMSASLSAGDVVLWDVDALRMHFASATTSVVAAGLFASMVPAEDLTTGEEDEEERRWKSRVAFYRRTLTGDRRPDFADRCGGRGGHRMANGDGDSASWESGKLSFFRRPYFRYGPPPLTVRQAELHGLIPYRRMVGGVSEGGAASKAKAWGSDNAIVHSIPAHPDREVVRAIFRGVVFSDESYYRLIPDDGETFENIVSQPKEPLPTPVALHRERSCSPSVPPVATETMYVDGDRPLPGQDKYLGGVASPCGEYIYGMPGFARRVVSVHVPTGRVELIGDEYPGPFKWLRGVEVPPNAAHPRGLCIGLPSNANSVLKIDPETGKVSTFGADSGLLGGVWKYHGGAMFPPTRKLYAIPANANRVLKIDAYTEDIMEIGPDFGDGKQKWYGGIYSSYNGCVYGIPHNETGVLKIDPSRDVATIVGDHLPKGLWKWHGGLATEDGTKIYGFPNNSDSVLVVDVTTDAVRTVNGGTDGVLTSGRHRRPHNGKYKYLGGALSPNGRYAYLFPSCAERVLRIDTRTDDVRCVGPMLLEGSCKYQNGFSSDRDGAVYGIPQNARCVIRIIPPSEEGGEEVIDMVYCGDDFLPYGDKFEGGVQGKDGAIYCMPLRAKAVLKVIPPVAPGRDAGGGCLDS